MKHRTVYWICQACGWAAIALLNIVFTMIYYPHWQVYVMYVWGALWGIAVTHVLRARIRREQWLKLPFVRLLPRLAAASVVTGVVLTGTVSLVAVPLLGFNRGTWIPTAVLYWSMYVFFWCIFYFSFHYFESSRNAQLEKAELSVVMKEAQLRALRAQVNPHFIFNCLNSLRALIVEDPLRAQNMVTQLSDILRYSLQSSATDTVRLGIELEAVDSYLKLEGVRLEERLRVAMDIQPESLDARVPPMLVQTLVENGIKHGVATLPHGGELQVSSRVENGALHLRVSNSGQLRPSASGTQIGLENARKRLRLMYGDDASLSIENDGPGSVVARVMLPV